MSKGKTPHLLDYYINEVFQTERGNTILVLQNRYVTEINEKGREVKVSIISNDKSNTYVNGDVVVISLDKNGELNWSRKIRINQTETSQVWYGKYGMLIDKDKIYLVFNDDIDNYEKKNKNTVTYPTSNFSIRKGISTICSVDFDGNIKEEIFMYNKELEGRLVPKVSYQISDDELIILTEHKEKNKGLILKVK
jgi:hypothetical protein